MNKSIPFINIADINCWMVYLMPFSESDRYNYDLVNSYQHECIEEKVFGMGWGLDCQNIEFGETLNDISLEKYTETAKLQYNSEELESSHLNAINLYCNIKKGDYVIMKFKDSRYYIGKLATEVQFVHKPVSPYNRLSWGAFVEEWVEFKTEEELPSEIVGRFSQRIHSTVQRIVPYRQKLLTISSYETNSLNPTFPVKIPKLKITKENFIRSLTYKELEDLVALFIYLKHCNEGYVLLPSSCKLSQQNYEFRFVSNGKQPITCQVKNQAEIDIDRYINDTAYKKIYIFCGLWSNEKVEKLKNEYEKYKQIFIISPDELFKVLYKADFFKNPYYSFEKAILKPCDLNLEGYEICKSLRKAKNKSCKITDDFVCFTNNDVLFYSAEFEALILSGHFLEDRNKEYEYIQEILTDLQR